MQYTVTKDQKTMDTWRVEAIDEKSDGEVYVAIFSGPNAEKSSRIRRMEKRSPRARKS